MKKWGSVAGLVMIVMFFLSVGIARADTNCTGTVCTTTVTIPADTLVCPNECRVTTTTFIDPDGTTSTGIIYQDTTTNDLLTPPSGYSPETMATNALSVGSGGRETGGGGVEKGTLGTKIGDYGPPNYEPMYAGTYLAPDGNYYPIDTSQRAIRTWARKGMAAITLNCPDSTTPDFSASADTFKECRTAKSSYSGNRVQRIGPCADGTLLRTKITNTCLLKCPDITTTFKGTYVCAKRQFLDDPCIKVLSSFTCQPIGISGHVYFDENNSCSSSTGWGETGVADQVGGVLNN